MEQTLAELETTIDTTIERAAEEGVDLMGENSDSEDMDDGEE